MGSASLSLLRYPPHMTKPLRSATERARALRRPATPAERALWRYLARSGAGAKFSRQMPVGPYFADFLCRGLGLIPSSIDMPGSP